jgi:phytoene dehydrogenase-like protein
MIDAVVVGSGPNGLTAAIAMAMADCKVAVFEANSTLGGGVRSAELTLPGFTHDVCSAVHPFAAASPFWRTLPLADYGLEWIQPPIMLAHPFDDGSAMTVTRSLDETAAGAGVDAQAYRSTIGAVVSDWPYLERAVLGPLGLPHHPIRLARFGARALRSANSLARAWFADARTRALFGGIAAHAMQPLDRALTAGVGLTLGAMCHVAGWPMPRGGAQRVTDALTGLLRALGAELVTGCRIENIDALPPAHLVLCDLSPRPFLQIAGHRLPSGYRRVLERYRYGLGVFKVDWALGEPIPWAAAACRRAGTIHLGGSLREIAGAESDVWLGRGVNRPFVLLNQPTLFDQSRAPAGRHVAWAYCHVPSGWPSSALDHIETQVERFAPGFRQRILARAVMTPADVEAHNANLVGGDIAAGVTDLRQFFARPSWRHYATPVRGLYLCSAATPPGVGVHGMCGYHAAARALRDVLGVSPPPLAETAAT